ncbi:SulP family sulfate permease [Hydrogenivirga caldilitoris]|uniref:SulP family sulfate permease n=1 Tax=Hydrogenivirga caldilitoris TaxID=246264 RepID=A0A497XVY8_9AQUI|nr:SulP family inorganic anion transporter [Hydrogenivirga caldilitoris]RLJ71322.1 SulP family sulfate permease [Hydrogenivirga caldilitoris]
MKTESLPVYFGFPFPRWFKGYSKDSLVRDLVAGITVAAVYVPQAMAYALLAGMPPITGLYTAFIATIVAALFGSSRFLGTGPVAMTCLLSASVLFSLHIQPQSDQWVAYMGLLALMVGIVRLLVGVFKLGFIVDLISNSVVIGFTAAGAIVIALSQFKHMLGYQVVSSTHIFTVLADMIKKIELTNPYTLVIGVGAYLIIWGAKRVNPYLPGALIAVFLTALVTYLFKLQGKGVAIVGEVPQGLPDPTLPPIDFQVMSQMWGGALVVAFFGLIEAVAIAKTLAIRTGDKWDPNQELIGQGLANIAVAFFKGFPAGGSFSRSSLNYALGAKSPLASIVTGALVGVTLFLLAPVFYYLPKATLAAVVLSAVINLIRPQDIIRLYKINKVDGVVGGLTFISVFFMDLWVAITLGVILSLGTFVYRTMYPRIVILSRDPESKTFVNVEKRELPECPQILYIRPNMSIYFGNAQYVYEYIVEKVRERLLKGPLKFVLIDMEAVNYTDATGSEALIRLIKAIRALGAEAAFANIGCDVYPLLENAGFGEVVKHELVFDSKGQSIVELFARIDHDYCREQCPYVVFKECLTVKEKELEEKKTA